MKTFPVLQFIARHGRLMSYVLLALGVIAAAIAGYAASSITVAASGLGIGLLAAFALRVFSELVEVIVETLLPH